MRHEDIQTTMRYYVKRTAQSTADAVWAAYEGPFSNKSSNTQQISDLKKCEVNAVSAFSD
jgi:hypothetical protein